MIRNFLLFCFISNTLSNIVTTSYNQQKIEKSIQVNKHLEELENLLKTLDVELDDKKLELQKERNLVSQIKSQSVKNERQLKKMEPAIIDIPVPKIKETELEVVHVFPQGYPGGYGGGGGGQGYGGGYGSAFSPNLVPSYSVSTNLNGDEQVNNFWGFNPSS